MADFISGLDLGQLADYTAMVTLERTTVPDPDGTSRTVSRYDVRHLHRWALGTPYTAIVADLKEWFGRRPLHGSTLVIDKTGVGVAVVDMIREVGLGANAEAFTITAGHKATLDTVPKLDLVAAVQATLGTDRLRFARDLEHTATLVAELKAFRVKVTADRNETFSCGRERDHDDLVLGLALAVWHCERYGDLAPTGYPPGDVGLPKYLGRLAGLPTRW